MVLLHWTVLVCVNAVCHWLNNPLSLYLLIDWLSMVLCLHQHSIGYTDCIAEHWFTNGSVFVYSLFSINVNRYLPYVATLGKLSNDDRFGWTVVESSQCRLDVGQKSFRVCSHPWEVHTIDSCQSFWWALKSYLFQYAFYPRDAASGYSDRNVSVCPSVRHAPVLYQNEES